MSPLHLPTHPARATWQAVWSRLAENNHGAVGIDVQVDTVHDGTRVRVDVRWATNDVTTLAEGRGATRAAALDALHANVAHPDAALWWHGLRHLYLWHIERGRLESLRTLKRVRLRRFRIWGEGDETARARLARNAEQALDGEVDDARRDPEHARGHVLLTAADEAGRRTQRRIGRLEPVVARHNDHATRVLASARGSRRAREREARECTVERPAD